MRAQHDRRKTWSLRRWPIVVMPTPTRVFRPPTDKRLAPSRTIFTKSSNMHAVLPVACSLVHNPSCYIV
eukprot:m.90451 g.90451  ORF g.90451 m.90451 type:complete len:69 (+) comp16458_c0_seq2:1153-1359(+)